MARTKVVNDKIQSALAKLKASRTDKEVELIDMVSHMYEGFKEAKAHAVEKVEETFHDIDDSVHDHPWRYIGGAALGGFLLGILLKRR